jgi:hypothetical protein
MLALARRTWGEAAFGLNLAQDLRSRGQQCMFVTSPDIKPLLSGSGIEDFEFSEQRIRNVKEFISGIIHKTRASSIVLCDFQTTDGTLSRCGVDASFLSALGLPLVAVDTWDHRLSGHRIDLFMDKYWESRAWLRKVPRRLRPCPILNPGSDRGTCSFLPTCSPAGSRVRSRSRADLGIPTKHRAILLCTARWQVGQLSDKDGRRTAKKFLDLLAEYINALGPRVHLVHVGPSRLRSFRAMGNRYHWLPQQGPKLDAVMGGVDLLVSGNVSASTVSRAMLMQVPAIVLENGCYALNEADANLWLGSHASRRIAKWLPRALPLYPFRLWPLGGYQFLSKLLDRNPYCDAIDRIEWLHAEFAIEALRSLLFDSATREQLQNRQSKYIRMINKLPSPGEAFEEIR